MERMVLTAPEGMWYTDGEGYYKIVYPGTGKTGEDFHLVSASDLPSETEKEDVKYV